MTAPVRSGPHNGPEATRAQEAANEARRRLEEFEGVVAQIAELNLSEVWEEATEAERRILIDGLLDTLTVFPDRLVVSVCGAPRFEVRYCEVGLKCPLSESDCVGGGT